MAVVQCIGPVLFSQPGVLSKEYTEPMLTKRRLQALKRERQFGIGRLLLLARRDFLSRLSHKLHDKGGAGLVHSASGLLPFIDLEGTRSTELARRLGISKQAVGKAVHDFEAQEQ